METHSILKFSSFVFYGNFMSNLYLISENHVIFVNEEKKTTNIQTRDLVEHWEIG